MRPLPIMNQVIEFIAADLETTDRQILSNDCLRGIQVTVEELFGFPSYFASGALTAVVFAEMCYLDGAIRRRRLSDRKSLVTRKWQVSVTCPTAAFARSTEQWEGPEHRCISGLNYDHRCFRWNVVFWRRYRFGFCSTYGVIAAVSRPSLCKCISVFAELETASFLLSS